MKIHLDSIVTKDTEMANHEFKDGGDYKNVRQLIHAYLAPRIAILHSRAKNTVHSLLNQLVRFKGQMTGEVNLNDADYERNVVINTTVANDGHVHSTTTFDGSVDATPNTLVKRDGLGRIKSSGINVSNTGLKLANGTDIASLFRNIASYPFSVANPKTGSGNCVNSISLSFNNGNGLISLSRNRYNLCPRTRHPNVKKDGC